ncbi:MAG: serine--tRNA ligase, partial [Nitrospirota bacterium]
MLDVKYIRDNPELVIEKLGRRGPGYPPLIEQVINLEAEKRALLAKVEGLKRQRNEASKAIGLLKRKKAEEVLDNLEVSTSRVTEIEISTD